MTASTITADALRDLLRVSDDGLARLDRRVYTDAEIFEREMSHVWEKHWIFLAHESQLPKPNDFITAQIGRQPVILIRNRAGKLGAFINACTHRGAPLCRSAKGNAKLMACPYHGWTYDADGALVSVNEEATGAYPESFDKKALGLTPVAKLESYRGFVFASLNADVPSLAEHLGGAAVFIDLLVDQSTQGWEVLRGHSSYTYDGNWKLQAENGVDSYHAPTVHRNFTATIENRKRSASKGDKVAAMNVRHDREQMHGGFYDFGHGHLVIWRDWDNPQDRFNYADLPALTERLGAVKAQWAVGRLRNLFIFPNLMLMDQMSTQIRVIQPLSVGKTKVTGYPFAPTGEAPDKRRRRLRFYEDFFNPSGMATPDDLEVFNLSQKAFAGTASGWSDISRGARHQIEGADRFAEELGIRPVASGGWIEDEGLFVGMYRAWMARITAGLPETRHE
jgi:benzoate/toluate 1,2-dioxygenase alpha subunit